jgi:hypothetical protein
VTVVASPAVSTRGGPSWLAAPLLTLLAFWTARLLADPARGCFLDSVNLPFHEAGHLFLAPFGSTLQYLGGTLGQLAVPILLAGYFLLVGPTRPLGAAVCAWWVGENLLNISVYMADARDLALPLVGGGDHDWNELFYRFGLLGEDSVRAISTGTRGLGALVMLLGLAWVTLFALPARIRGTMIASVEERAPGLMFLIRGTIED